MATHSCGAFTDLCSVAFSVPHGAFRERQLFGDVGSGMAAAIATLLLLLLSSVVLLLLRSVRRERGDEVEVVTLGDHPNLVPTPHCSSLTQICF